MKRLSLYLTLGVVAIGVLVLARLIGVSDSIASSGLTVPIDASSPAVVEGPLVHTEARSGRIDYRLLDYRLTTMMADPQMVGLAVAVVEDGEVTFAKGYGETLAGSRDPVTVDTVFRWASLSKGIASTFLQSPGSKVVIRSWKTLIAITDDIAPAIPGMPLRAVAP